MTSILLIGFLLGIRHAFDPDHIAAVASLASNTTSLKRALHQGAVWGLGHTLTLVIVAGASMSLQTSIPTDIANYLEVIVGVMLILLGIDVLRRLIRDRIHFHAHIHADGERHFHAHSHKGEQSSANHTTRHDHDHPKGFPYRFLFIGLMHGIAGSAALIVLTLNSAGTFWAGLIYISLFGIGSMAGMAAISVAISLPMKRARALSWTHNGLQALTGSATTILGVITVLS